MSGGLETDLAKMVAAHVRKKGCQEYQEREPSSPTEKMELNVKYCSQCLGENSGYLEWCTLKYITKETGHMSNHIRTF